MYSSTEGSHLGRLFAALLLLMLSVVLCLCDIYNYGMFLTVAYLIDRGAAITRPVYMYFHVLSVTEPEPDPQNPYEQMIKLFGSTHGMLNCICVDRECGISWSMVI